MERRTAPSIFVATAIIGAMIFASTSHATVITLSEDGTYKIETLLVQEPAPAETPAEDDQPTMDVQNDEEPMSAPADDEAASGTEISQTSDDEPNLIETASQPYLVFQDEVLTDPTDAPIDASSPAIAELVAAIENGGTTEDTRVFQTATGYGSSLDPSTLDMLITPHLQDHPRLDRHIVQAVIATESAGRVDALSHKGAQGLMQLMPATARRLKVDNAFDPAQNVRGGMEELARLFDRYDDLALALAAYNAGEGAVNKYEGIPPFAETQTYVLRILQRIHHTQMAEIEALRTDDLAALEALGLARGYLSGADGFGSASLPKATSDDSFGETGPILVDLSSITP